ncbi:uncharacterized protein LOC141630644 [Silene latifolia]|uniref:uncharacterized protein LOC141630644 n=1 Tax=Silene latifolia TaxID=37657 RepID=UPI003D788800
MRGPNLTNDERHRIGCYLFENSSNGKPNRGSMNILAAKYQVDRRTTFDIWTVAKRQREHGEMLQLNSKLKGKKGRPTLEVPVERILAISLGDRGSMKIFGAAIGVSAGTIFNWVKQRKIRSHTSALHPALTEENKFQRLYFALSKLSYDRISCSLKFKEMSNIIHIDEKWFYITDDQAKFYLLMEEDTPYRACKSKSFITKVMFMAAVSRPIYDGNGNLVLMVTKDMLLNKVIPAIKSKWPESMSKNIIMKQDNARPHIKNDDLDFRMAATSNGFNISLTQQPANSPDLNVLDLGFFRSIQSLQEKKRAQTVDKLVSNVLEAWDDEPAQCIDDVWLSLQECMLEIMDRKGQNDYKVPHLKKNAQRLAGTLPRNLTADEVKVRECINHLHEAGRDAGLEEITTPLALTHPL